MSPTPAGGPGRSSGVSEATGPSSPSALLRHWCRAALELPAPPRSRPMSSYRVDSEVGQLRQAIVHRPDLELRRLTPTNKDDFLFDEVLWVKKARQAHDAFVDVLHEAGVTTHHSDELPRETVAIPEARKPLPDGAPDDRNERKSAR